MKGWRTIALFGLQGLLYLAAWEPLTAIVNPQWIATGSALLAILLRIITTTPVGKRG